jgi:hypothetical protein
MVHETPPYGHAPKYQISLTYLERQLEAQWAEPVSLTFHPALRKLNKEPSIGASHQCFTYSQKWSNQMETNYSRYATVLG